MVNCRAFEFWDFSRVLGNLIIRGVLLAFCCFRGTGVKGFLGKVIKKGLM